MVDVAVEGGGISGDANSGEGRWGDVLEVANDVGSGVIAVSLWWVDIVLLSYHLDSPFNSRQIIYPIQTTEA